MRSVFTSINGFVAGVIWALVPTLALLAAPVTTENKAPAETPNEKARKALDATVNLDVSEKPLDAVMKALSEQTKVKFLLDPRSFGNGGAEFTVSAKLQDVKARSALRTVLGRFHFTFIVSDGDILITTEELAIHQQMRQPVSLDLDDVALATALKQLVRTTGTNVVLDPRVSKEAKGAGVTLQVEDVPLETAVRLMAEMADLKAVRVGNVLFVTTAERADRLRAEPDSTLPGVGISPPAGAVEGPRFFPAQPPMAVPAQPVAPQAAPAPKGRHVNEP